MIIVKRMKKKKIEKTLKYSKLDCKRCRMENWKEKQDLGMQTPFQQTLEIINNKKNLFLTKKSFSNTVINQVINNTL